MHSCPACGAATSGGAFCSTCGKPLRTGVAQERPVGVTFVAIGFFLLAAGAVLTAFALLVAGPFIDAAWFPIMDWAGAWARAIRGVLAMLAFFALLFGALAVAVGVGLLHGKEWAWVAALAVAGIAGVGSLLSLAELDLDAILGVLVWGGVLYYLLRPEVRAYFGRAPR